MNPTLTYNGTLLGTRALEANKRTGELSKFQMVDVYNTEDGPAEFRASLDLPLPEPGTAVEIKVRVTAYSGFVKETRSGEGVAGDARVNYTATAVNWLQASKRRAS